MRYIPFERYRPPDAWLESMATAYAELIILEEDYERSEFIDENSDIWGDLKESLSELSHGKCWYSEAKDVFSYYHVDHFRPKNRLDERTDFSQPVNFTSGYWWLAFSYTNYRLAGAVGNVNKRDKFAVIRNKANSPVDPIEDEVQYLLDPVCRGDVELLTFDESGTILPADADEDSFDYKRADYTIKVLKLDSHTPLKEARRVVWEYCSRLLHDIATLKVRQKTTPSASRRASIEEKLNLLNEMREPDHEFTMTVEACIKAFY